MDVQGLPLGKKSANVAAELGQQYCPLKDAQRAERKIAKATRLPAWSRVVRRIKPSEESVRADGTEFRFVSSGHLDAVPLLV